MDSLLTYHSFISVLKMTASETNFGMTKKHVFHCVSCMIWHIKFRHRERKFHVLHASVYDVIYILLTEPSIRELQDQSGKGNQTVEGRAAASS